MKKSISIILFFYIFISVAFGYTLKVNDFTVDVTDGREVTITAEHKDGYNFSCWEVVSGDLTLDDASKKTIIFSMPKSDVELKSNYTTDTVLTVNPGDIKYTQTYNTTKDVTAPKPLVESIFVTFNYNGNGSDSKTVEAKNVFYNWTLSGGGSISSPTANPTTYTYGTTDGTLTANYTVESVTLPSATREGYILLGWSTSSTATTAEYSVGETFTPDADTVLYAVWEEETYAIEFTWTPTRKTTSGVSQLTKGVKIRATAATTISLGDGTETAVTAGNKLYTHTYATAGEYAVRITDNVVTELDLSRHISNKALAIVGTDYGNNQVTSLSVGNATALTYVSCWCNQLTSLDVSNNTALTELVCGWNQLTSLDVSNNTALTYLGCYDNQLASLDVSNNTALTYLSCFSNQLTSLDVSNNTALTSLECGSNQLTALDVSKNTELVNLECYNNQLKSLNVSTNTALKELICYANNLTALDVTASTALTRLSCHSNQLKSLNVSTNTALTNISCRNNQLTELDVSNNTALTELYCYSNQLTKLDISNNTALTDLYCHSNNLTELSLVANTAINKVCCVQESLSNIYLNPTQKTSLTVKDEESGCSSITTAKTIHKHANTAVPAAIGHYYDGMQNAGINTYDPSTATFVDLVGTQNGKISGATWENGALKFGGKNDWVNLGIINYKNPTLEAVITYNGNTSELQNILSNAQQGGYILGINTAGQAVFEIRIGEYWHDATAGTALVVGQKYHLVGTYDGSNVKLYINGEEAKSEVCSGSIKNPESNTVLAMGINPVGSKSSTQYRFNGSIYMARIYEGALTAAQVKQNYQEAMLD